MASPRIMTHLFADGGRIVKSTRTDYSEHLGRDDMAAVVKNMMKEQHKAMFVALRSGELDALIGFSEDDAVSTEAKSLNAAAPSNEVKSDGVVAKDVAIVAGASKDAAQVNPTTVPALVPTAAGQVSVSSSAASVGHTPVVSEKMALGDPKAYAASRPASIFSVPPPSSNSIFGEVGIDEKSLDDAILSYLAEDPEDDEKS